MHLGESSKGAITWCFRKLNLRKAAESFPNLRNVAIRRGRGLQEGRPQVHSAPGRQTEAEDKVAESESVDLSYIGPVRACVVELGLSPTVALGRRNSGHPSDEGNIVFAFCSSEMLLDEALHFQSRLS